MDSKTILFLICSLFALISFLIGTAMSSDSGFRKIAFTYSGLCWLFDLIVVIVILTSK